MIKEFKNLLGLCTVFFFFCSGCTYNMKTAVLDGSIYDMNIDSQYGSMQKANLDSEKNKLVILIDDSPTNYQTQLNIASILNQFFDQYTLNLVAVEGSSGFIDTSEFRNMGNKRSRNEVTNHYMKKGKITGPEFLSITGKHEFVIWGIEDEDVYDSNFKSLMNAMRTKDEAVKACMKLFNRLVDLREVVFSPELKKFDESLDIYRFNIKKFGNFYSLLNSKVMQEKINLDKYENYQRYGKWVEFKNKVNFKKAGQQYQKLLSSLSSRISYDDKQLLQNKLKMAKMKSKSQDFYNLLGDILDKYNVDYNKYPLVLDYLEAIKVNLAIDHDSLVLECRELEGKVKESYCVNKDQKLLVKKLNDISVLIRLIEFKMPFNEFIKYRTQQGGFESKEFISFINEFSEKYNVYSHLVDEYFLIIDKCRESTELYYKYAMARSRILINNALEKMNEMEENEAVVVVGSFHIPTIIEILDGEKIPYALIVPKTSLYDNSTYFDVMANQENTFKYKSESIPEQI